MLVERLLASADSFPHRAAVADPTTELSYANLVRLACVMRRRIEQTTDCPRVGLLLPSCAGFAASLYGALWAGRTVIPLNFLLHPAELAGVVSDAEIDTVFAVRPLAGMLASLPVRTVLLEDLPLKRDLILQHLRRRPSPPRVDADDVAVILYTSGTSGQPKGVCLSHRNLASNADACIERARLTGEHRFLGLLPLFHSFGLTAMLIVPLALGASVYYLPRFQPAAVLHAIRDRRISIVMAVASMYAALLRTKSSPSDDLRQVEYVISGGEALPQNVYDAFRERFGVSILQGYGLTETSPVVALDMPWAHRPGTVGQPVPGVEVGAFDDAGRRLAAGQIGELWVHGPNVMKGYFKKPAETEAVLIHAGWFKTGDMGLIDGEGFIAITGRRKEMIIVGGDNVYPREIEAVLEGHPAVAEAAVIGQPDSSRGEVVVAFVVLKPGERTPEIELRDFCRDKLAGYKQPKRVVVRDDLPRGPTGKIVKRQLKELC